MECQYVNRMITGLIILLGLYSADVVSAEMAPRSEPPSPEVSAAPSQEEKPAISRRTSAVVLSTPFVEWPRPADREALVYLVLSINAEGKVTNVELAESGFHEPRFVLAAMKVGRGMRFRPATLNGKPVDSCAVLPVSFGLGSGTQKWVAQISDEFRRGLKKIDALFEKKDYEGAHLESALLLKKVKYGYEYAVLQAAMAESHALLGRDHLALHAAEAATIRTTPRLTSFQLDQQIPKNKASNYLLPSDVISRLLRMRIALAASNGALVKAMQAYYELAGLEKLPAEDPHATLAVQIASLLKGERPLVARGALDQGSWDHNLYRSRFAFGQVQGAIKALSLVCGDKRREIRYEQDMVWEVPANWDDCTITVSGDKGATFTLLEFADGSAVPKSSNPAEVPASRL
jgi:hypothetical protein